MRRALAPAFVTTVLACNKTPVSETPPDVTMTRNPPPAMFDTDASEPPVTTVDSGASESDATGSDAAAPHGATASSAPHRKRKRTAAPVTGSAPEGRPLQLRAPPLNPTDDKGRLIYAMTDDRCLVEVPYQGPPRQLPRGMSSRSFEEVDCPAAMDDPAWDNCSTRLSFDEASSKCLCITSYGNPPPPPRVVPCPADVKAGGKKKPSG